MTTQRLNSIAITTTGSLLVVLLCSQHAFCLESQAKQDASTASKIIEAPPSSVNLNTIVKHQEALARECLAIQERKLSQVEFLTKYDRDNDNVQLARPLSIKMPAICIFLLNQLDLPLTGSSDPDSVIHRADRVDLVNWIYPQDDDDNNGQELDDARGSKRHPKPANNLTKREEYEFSSKDKDILHDFLYDQHMVDDRTRNDLPVDEADAEMRNQVDAMIHDRRFAEAIKLNRDRLTGRLSPVILVPGLLGSRLQARTNKVRRINVLCSKRHDWQDMWLSLRHLLPLLVDCWLDNVRLEYDPTTGWTRQPEGVEARVADFGSVESVRHLDRKSPHVTAYFSDIIDQYERLGYVPDANLLAAPYDFRLAPQQMQDYFLDLKTLTERAREGVGLGGTSYGRGSSLPITYVCHSMGCTHMLVFLRAQGAAWRKKNVRKLIALSSPWAGAFKALKAVIVGDQLELPLVSEFKMRKLARNYPSLAYLMPQPEVFGGTNSLQAERASGPLLVESPQRNYHAHEIEQLLRDANQTRQLHWYQQTKGLIKPDQPIEDLRVDCIHGLNTPTMQTIVFRRAQDFVDGPYELVMGQGDGTVNLESLVVCERWQQRLPKMVSHKVVMNTNHLGVLSHKDTLRHIVDDVLRSPE